METFCQRASAGVYELEEEWEAMAETVQLTSMYSPPPITMPA